MSDDLGWLGRVGRRAFLRLGGLTLLVSAVDPSFLRAQGLGARVRDRLRARPASGKTLVHIFQRFGADGLNTVIPIEPSEHAVYRSYRPGLGIDRAHPDLRAISADFAFHPLLKDGLFRLWQDGSVAVLPNVGYPEASRSHFDSQLFVDRGTPWDKTTRDGWLNRWVQAAAPSSDPLRVLAFGKSMPASLEGPAPALAISDIAALSVTGEDPARNRKFFELQQLAYGEAPDGTTYDAEVHAVGEALVRAVQSVPPELPPPAVPFPAGPFGKALEQLSQLLRSGLFAIEIAQVDLGGWDTHGSQQEDVMSGVFPDLLRQFSDGIAALVDDLGPARMADVVVVTASEFGRTARENGSRGTDHGSAWTSFVVGGGVRGGIYFGPGGWHGLTDLRDDRDLKYSLDFRDLFSEVLSRHLGELPAGVFPGWRYAPIGLW